MSYQELQASLSRTLGIEASAMRVDQITIVGVANTVTRLLGADPLRIWVGFFVDADIWQLFTDNTSTAGAGLRVTSALPLNLQWSVHGLMCQVPLYYLKSTAVAHATLFTVSLNM